MNFFTLNKLAVLLLRVCYAVASGPSAAISNFIQTLTDATINGKPSVSIKLENNYHFERVAQIGKHQMKLLEKINFTSALLLVAAA